MSGYPTPEMRKKMQDVKHGTPPSGPAGASSANGKRILIDAPDGPTILAARHLDATEGRVQVGLTVDTATRSAITAVLSYVARAHNAPPAAGEKGAARRPCRHCPDPLCPEDCPECGSPIHDLDAVPAQHQRDIHPEEQQPMADTTPAVAALLIAFDEIQLAEMHAAASARIKQVRALHQRQYEECTWCSTNDRHTTWPCPTIRALDGEEPQS